MQANTLFSIDNTPLLLFEHKDRQTRRETQDLLARCGGSEKSRLVVAKWTSTLLGLGVLGDSLGALRHCVLGQFTGQEKPDCGLDLSGGDGAAPVVVGQTGGLCGDALKDVIHEGVHDRHGLGADASVRVDLLQHLVDVDGVALPPPPPALLIPSSLGLGLAGGLLSSFACGFGWHVDCMTLGNTENDACRPI